jgi:hypothetical protein
MTTNQIMSNEITSTSSLTLKSCVSLECDDIKCSFKMKIIYFNECKQELWSQSLNTVWIISQEVVNSGSRKWSHRKNSRTCSAIKKIKA